jgi:hypothetical protein
MTLLDNNGQRAELGLSWSAAFDPKQSLVNLGPKLNGNSTNIGDAFSGSINFRRG